MKKENEIEIVKNGDVNNPLEIIQQAISKGADLDKIEKLMILQERWEATQAKKLYNSEMVSVQREIPTVAKNLKNNQTNSKYVALDDIINRTREIYTNHGFSITFYEGDSAKSEQIRICADVVHSAGHKETYFFDIPLDGVGLKGNANMTKIHAKASSTSYARRYLMCMIWNIPTGDDNDGNTTTIELINSEEAKQINILVEQSKISREKFLEWLEVGDVTNIPKNMFPKAIKVLEAKLKKKIESEGTKK